MYTWYKWLNYKLCEVVGQIKDVVFRICMLVENKNKLLY